MGNGWTISLGQNVFYDKLKTDLKGEMRRLMKFLDHVQYKETDFYCMLQQSEGSLHRNSTKKVDVLQYFSSEQISTIEEYILHIEKIAAKINGEYHKIERNMWRS